MEHFGYIPDNHLVPDQQSTRSTNSDADWLLSRIQLLCSAYPRDDYTDPEGFIAQLALIVAQYDPGVVEYVTDPRTGLQRRLKFRLTIADVVEALEAEANWRDKVAKNAAIPRGTTKLPAPKFFAAESYDAMVEKHGRPFGVFEAGRITPYGAK